MGLSGKNSMNEVDPWGRGIGLQTNSYGTFNKTK